MAKTKLGKTYEAMLEIALEQVINPALIHWNETPQGMTVEPDFVIGQNANYPDFVIMVSHGDSSKNSDMKFWRNLSELAEVKTSLSNIPRAYNIVFDAAIKESLLAIEAATFDGQLVIEQCTYGNSLLVWAKRNEKSLPVDQREKVAAIKRRLAEEATLSACFECFCADLADCIGKSNVTMHQLWEEDRRRSPGFCPTRKETFIRRGISKLLVYEDLSTAIDLYLGKPVPSHLVPSYAFSLGFARKGIGHAIPSDIEIQNAVRALDPKMIMDMCKSVENSDTMQSWLKQIRAIANIELMGQYVRDNYIYLKDKDQLISSIDLLYRDPNALVEHYDLPDTWPPQDVWLVSYLMELVKAETRTANGYGISLLARDVIANGYGTPSDLTSASQFGGGFGFSAWVMRKESPFRQDLVEGVAAVLSNKLESIGEAAVYNLIDSKSIENGMINNLLEAKICSYRLFSPLVMILEEAEIIKESNICQLRTCFAEHVASSGQTGLMTVAQVNNTIIVWQSAFKNPRDKRKELCGRAPGLRYQWNDTKQVFERRKGAGKMILFLDGLWTQEDLDALISAGWDEIYYPDEIDKLKAAII